MDAQLITLHFDKGLFWDAYFVPLSILLGLEGGLVNDARIEQQSVTLELTGGSYDDVPDPITIINTLTIADTSYPYTGDVNGKMKWEAANTCYVRWDIVTSSWWLVEPVSVEQWEYPAPVKSTLPPDGVWPAVGSLGSPAPTLSY